MNYNLVKGSINGQMYNIVNYEQYFQNRDLYQEGTAVQYGNIGLPVMNTAYDPRQPGFYPQDPYYAKVVMPTQQQMGNYTLDQNNMINFNDCKNFKDVINATMGLENMERAILTTPDNIFKPIVKPSNGPEMMGMKDACSAKNMDAYKYKDRIPQFNNDIRLFNGDNLSLPKLISLAEAFDIKLTLTFEDANANVPNPMGKKISVVLTNNNTQIR